MAKGHNKSDLQSLPECARDFIKLVVKKMRYRKKVRADVQDELSAHFEDELRDCATNKEKEQKAQQLIERFGDAKLLGILLRRAKKRCRPLWRTIFARTFQTIGILILFFIAYTGWFLTGKPTVNVDYLERFNEISKPEIISGDNAWVNYEKAIELFAEPNETLEKIIKQPFIEFSDLDKLEQIQTMEWIEKNEAAWDEFVKGSLRPYYYRKASCQGEPNNPFDNWLLSVLMPHLHPLSCLARLGNWRSKIALESGKIAQSLEDCLVAVRAGSHLQGKGNLVEQLVGIVITGLGYDGILAIMAEQELSATTIAELHEELQEIYRKGYPEIDVESERLLFLDTVQRLFTDGGPGGGHLIPRSMKMFDDFTDSMNMNHEAKALRVIAYTGGSMIHARRNETIVQGNKMYDKIAEVLKMSPYERHIRQVNSDDVFLDLPRYRYLILEIFIPAGDRVSQIRYEAKACYEAVLTLLALQNWRMKKGNLPDNLEELVAETYLEQLPMDPYSDKSLVYKKVEGHFILYSIGQNFIDDGGKVVPSEEDECDRRRWSDEGDHVFWPVQK